jgi:hypothetical protein
MRSPRRDHRNIVDDLVVLSRPRAIVHAPLARQPAARSSHPVKGRADAAGLIARVRNNPLPPRRAFVRLGTQVRGTVRGVRVREYPPTSPRLRSI